MRLLDVGPSAVLVEVEGSAEALDLARFARAARVGAVEVVPAATTVLFDGVVDRDGLERVLATWSPSPLDAAGELVDIATHYDGEDLDEVAAQWGTDRDGAIARHTALTFTAAFCGFAPGFSYLAGLPDELAVPRLDSPRTRVPAGAVAVADHWCAVYPTASPGGWRLLGRTDQRLWDPSREQPALLPPGTRVRFVAA